MLLSSFPPHLPIRYGIFAFGFFISQKYTFLPKVIFFFWWAFKSFKIRTPAQERIKRSLSVLAFLNFVNSGLAGLSNFVSYVSVEPSSYRSRRQRSLTDRVAGLLPMDPTNAARTCRSADRITWDGSKIWACPSRCAVGASDLSRPPPAWIAPRRSPLLHGTSRQPVQRVFFYRVYPTLCASKFSVFKPLLVVKLAVWVPFFTIAMIVLIILVHISTIGASKRVRD